MSGGIKPGSFFDVELQDEGKLAIVVRNTKPFGTMEDCQRAFANVDDALRGIDRSKAALLVDLRAATGRNDKEFEATVTPLRRSLLQSFKNCALLVGTVIGKLQVERHMREDGLPVLVFLERDEARRALLAG
ncbi:MAG: hypothetical protein AAF799_02100 [Myxococcota bacterium]